MLNTVAGYAPTAGFGTASRSSLSSAASMLRRCIPQKTQMRSISTEQELSRCFRAALRNYFNQL